MTVGELIEELKQYNEDAKVIYCTDKGMEEEEIIGVIDTYDNTVLLG